MQVSTFMTAASPTAPEYTTATPRASTTQPGSQPAQGKSKSPSKQQSTVQCQNPPWGILKRGRKQAEPGRGAHGPSGTLWPTVARGYLGGWWMRESGESPTGNRDSIHRPKHFQHGGEAFICSPPNLLQSNHDAPSNHRAQQCRFEYNAQQKPVSSMAAVLGTTELLEMIMLQLDHRSLLKVQGVCQRWKQIINHSIQLQQVLFFKPRKTSDTKHTSNPLIEEIILPQLLLRSRNFVIPGKHPNFEACFRQEASWRKMLPQQAPASTIGVIEVIRHEKYRFTKLAIEPGLLRMEHILDALENGVLMPTPYNRVLWTTVARSLNFEIWGQNWVQTKRNHPEETPWIPANMDWDTLRLGVASMCLEQSDCDFVIVSEWPHRLFQNDICHCEPTMLDRWLEASFGKCEVITARELTSHTCVFKEGNFPVLKQLSPS
ncbi:uncharacterized protein N7482_005903 [Penicillium canariense]|uniref:F-box domain-containing protein n=1 Tax=Penicillium canariense TaxID=189055 RepID=A0A9W9I7D4_9EURO|nr:uncharacterized protein N7482_005903 [Penicillium canariense]KAJ5167122.1 hypothetical protein N7482_005903 [Penicillium canariense]